MSAPQRPLCFVLMPFGLKTDAAGRTIDFDAVYRRLIHPAVEEAALTPIRADEERTGGIIHKAMFERLILCEYAVADLTTANANVFYELGVRHAARPHSTVMIFSEGTRLPFDLGPLRAMPYKLDAAGKPADAGQDAASLAQQLRNARETMQQDVADSPLFTLLDGMRAQRIARERTDVLRQQVEYSQEVKDRLRRARGEGAAAVRAVERQVGDLGDLEAGIAVDLLLSYRGVKSWDDMIRLVETLPRPLASTVLVQEQYAFALNRAGRGEDAERVLTSLIRERGPSSETYGLLGRVYKDRWEAAKQAGETFQARGLLDQAIDAYRLGFEADWRDAYPGINAVTLMEIRQPPDPRRQALLPVVTYAVERRLASGEADYWDHATRLELAVLARDEEQVMDSLGKALAAVREAFEPETTQRNLRLIREAREIQGEVPAWSGMVEDELDKAHRRLAAG